jgi:hypothetical protein
VKSISIVAAALAMAVQGGEPVSVSRLSLAMSASEEFENNFHGAGRIANLTSLYLKGDVDGSSSRACHDWTAYLLKRSPVT